MVKARDIMTTNVVWVSKDTPASEAAEILLKNQITGMPVLAEDMTLVGVVTEKDLLRLFHAGGDREESTVGDFMTRPAVYYRENESCKAICEFMLVNYFRRIPVAAKNGQVVGIVSRPDVLRYVLRLKRAEVGGRRLSV
jgi:CBS domain-containing protein